MLLFAMGHNPDIFPDPERFEPERFTAEARLNKNPFEYVPFSAGSRNCVGKKLVFTNLEQALWILLQIYSLNMKKIAHNNCCLFHNDMIVFF